MSASSTDWIVRLSPREGATIEDLLALPYALDVWQRDADSLIAATPEATLIEIQRRKLASIQRLGTAAEFVAEANKKGMGKSR
jgi:hypothetical protein